MSKSHPKKLGPEHELGRATFDVWQEDGGVRNHVRRMRRLLSDTDGCNPCRVAEEFAAMLWQADELSHKHFCAGDMMEVCVRRVDLGQEDADKFNVTCEIVVKATVVESARTNKVSEDGKRTSRTGRSVRRR